LPRALTPAQFAEGAEDLGHIVAVPRFDPEAAPKVSSAIIRGALSL
jgi:hypothetical protein